MFQKIPKKFHEKTVQSHMLWLNLNKISEIRFLQSAHKQGNPLFSLSCDGLKTQIPMPTNSIGCPKIVSLSAPVLYWLSHLTCISSMKAKNERKTFIFTKLKISRYNPYFFAIFRRILMNWPPTYLLYSDLYFSDSFCYVWSPCRTCQSVIPSQHAGKNNRRIQRKTSTDQTTGNKLAPISHYNPCKWSGRQTPLKMFPKLKQKIPRQGRPIWYTVAEFKQNRSV